LRDRTVPGHLDVDEQLGKDGVYSWEYGHLWSEIYSDAINTNPTLCQNVKELCQLQETLLGEVADIFRAKEEGLYPTEEQQRDSFKVNQNDLLTTSLAAGNRH